MTSALCWFIILFVQTAIQAFVIYGRYNVRPTTIQPRAHFAEPTQLGTAGVARLTESIEDKTFVRSWCVLHSKNSTPSQSYCQLFLIAVNRALTIVQRVKSLWKLNLY